MTRSTHIEAHSRPTGHQRQPTRPRRNSNTEIRSPMPYNSHKALNRNTHTMWDNPGCLAPQPSTEVSGFSLVDCLDKDSYRLFDEAYREASARFRAGDLSVQFPPGCFRPAGPFVPADAGLPSSRAGPARAPG